MATKRKYFVTYAGATMEVFPTSVGTQKYTWQREQDQIFKRKKLSSKLHFKNDGKIGLYDFNYFAAIEATAGCDEIKIEIKALCSGQYILEWKGYFSTGGGTFDFDRCTFDVLPEPDDVYRCVFDNWEKVYNIFDYDVEDIIESQNVVYETLTGDSAMFCDDFVQAGQAYSGSCSGFIRCSCADTAYRWFTADYSSAADMIAKGWCVKEHTVTSEGDFVRVIVDNNNSGIVAPGFAPGDIVTETGFGNTATVCEVITGGIGLSPNKAELILKDISSGFTAPGNLIDNTPSGGTDEGTSLSYDTVAFCSVETEWESQLIDIPCAGGVCSNPSSYFLISTDCDTTGYCTFRRCPETIESNTFRGVRYDQLINSIITELCPDIVEMSSIFYEYNPDTSDPHYSAGINYMTSMVNRVMNLLISQESDIVDPTATNPATIGNVTLKKLLQWSREVFNVYWDITTISGDVVLQMEHFDFFSAIQAIDLTTYQFGDYVKSFNKYEHLKDQIPRNEKYLWKIAGGIDFIGKDIIYPSACAKEGQSVDHQPEELSTDVGFIENNDSVKEETNSFVMIATDLVSGDYIINQEAGLITGNIFSNAHLSWANLHYNYHRWNRYLSSGNMNGAIETFFSWKSNIKQPTIKVPGCCLDIDPDGYARTDLGDQVINKFAFIEKMELDFVTDILSFDLSYSI